MCEFSPVSAQGGVGFSYFSGCCDKALDRRLTVEGVGSTMVDVVV